MNAASPSRVPLRWQLARLAIAGSGRQAFLDHAAISRVLALTPPRHRRALALRVLSLSPHFFIYQWNGYPSEWSQAQVLEAEFERNRRSREQIAEHLLGPALPRDATVLDFGCGPGFLARAMSSRVHKVIAVDVSSGTLACARTLNPGPSYVHSRDSELPVESEAVDALYSVAVLQHIDPGDWPRYFKAFMRVLRPGGQGLCHVAIVDDRPTAYRRPQGLRGRYSLRFQESTSEAVCAVLGDSGFVDIRVTAIADMASVDDDVGRQHLVTFRKPDRSGLRVSDATG